MCCLWEVQMETAIKLGVGWSPGGETELHTDTEAGGALLWLDSSWGKATVRFSPGSADLPFFPCLLGLGVVATSFVGSHILKLCSNTI